MRNKSRYREYLEPYAWSTQAVSAVTAVITLVPLAVAAVQVLGARVPCLLIFFHGLLVIHWRLLDKGYSVPLFCEEEIRIF